MTVLDFALIAIFSFFFAWGLWVGFIRQLALVISLVLAFVLTGLFASQIGSLLSTVLASAKLGFALAYIVLVLACYLTIRLISTVLKKSATLSLANWLNRFLGGFFGLAKAYLLLAITYLFIAASPTALTPILHQSFFNPWLNGGANILKMLVKDQQLKEQFTYKPEKH